jgi:hypothetical protein
MDNQAQREREAVVAFLIERAANIRRYPFESRIKADAMVLVARELQDIADLLKRGEHLDTKGNANGEG